MIRPAPLLVALSCLWLGGVAEAATPKPAIPSARAAQSLLLDVAVAGKRQVAVGERGHIVYSDDQGVTWKQASVPTRVLLSAVHFPTERVGYAVGHDSTILVTRDGGQTWTVQYFREFDPDAVAEDEAGADMGDEYSEDYAEESWDEEDTGGGNASSRAGAPLLDVYFMDEQRGWAVGAYGLLLATADGGKTWEDRSDRVPNRDGWHLNAIAGRAPGSPTVYLAGEKGTFYRSDDAGDSFAMVPTGAGGSFFGLLAKPSGVVYAFGLQGALYRSQDAGRGWEALASGVTSGLNDGCVAPDGSTVITGNAGVILVAREDNAGVAGHARNDRQAVLSCAPGKDGLVLVGEGGAKRATADGRVR